MADVNDCYSDYWVSQEVTMDYIVVGHEDAIDVNVLFHYDMDHEESNYYECSNLLIDNQICFNCYDVQCMLFWYDGAWFFYNIKLCWNSWRE